MIESRPLRFKPGAWSSCVPLKEPPSLTNLSCVEPSLLGLPCLRGLRETTCARAEDEASHNVRNQHSFSPLRSVSFRPHTAELPTIRPITSEMAGDRPTTTLAFAPRRCEDQDQHSGGQGRTATLPAIAAKSSLMPRVRCVAEA